MPQHRPIRFKRPSISEEAKEYVVSFVERHPVASSATKALLAMAILGVGLTVAVTAPNIVGMFGRFAAKRRRGERERYNQLWRSFNQLRREKALTYVGEKDGELVYEFTKKGHKKIRNFVIETLEISTPPRWDGKWRIIIFDVPEKFRRARMALQKKLDDMGFCQFQKSVWVHPFPCEEEIEFLKEVFEAKPFVHILCVKEMPHAKVLNHFKGLL